MSIQSEITRLQTNVDNTLAAVTAMGGTVAANATSDDMAAAVYTIPKNAIITAKNLSVPVSAWSADSSSESYPYKAAVAIDGVTGDCYPTIVLSHEDAESSNYSSVAESYDGGVYIYAANVPDASFNVPLIACTPRPTSAASAVIATDISVPVSAWSADSSSESYPYKATIPISGVTGDHYPEVAFDHTEVESGDYSTVAESYDGGVYIYAKGIPSAAITVPTVFCTPIG